MKLFTRHVLKPTGWLFNERNDNERRHSKRNALPANGTRPDPRGAIGTKASPAIDNMVFRTGRINHHVCHHVGIRAGSPMSGRPMRKKGESPGSYPRRTRPIERPDGVIGAAELRKILFLDMLNINGDQRKTYDVWHHSRPLCRVILEPL
jgi:hypothetical protein